MTGHKAEADPAGPPGSWQPPVIAGTTADQRLLRAVPELVRAVLAALRAHVPLYRRLPAEQLSGDIARAVEHSVRGFGQILRTGGNPGGRGLDAVRESAARRADEGIPLESVLTAYHLGARICWAAVTAPAGPGDVEALRAVGGLLLDHLGHITAAATAGYFEERRSLTDDRHAARQTLLTALLDGAPCAEAAARAGLRPPGGYLVLSLAMAEHPDEAVPGVDPAIAGRRKLRRLRLEVEHQFRGSALSTLNPAGGLILIPSGSRPGDLTPTDWQRLADLVARTAQAVGVAVWAGAGAAEPAGVPAAAALAHEIGEVARACGRPAGLYRLEDLLLEYQLSRPSQARGPLAALLTPLEGNAELLTTLRTHLAGGLDRRHTARALHLHPNTVDYRLRRIAALTGLDPGRPGDLLRITAALAAREGTAVG
ncbi:PucR family transcriptional regulator [Kitasatospora sp. NPDC050543]|uniref:PucR family transcriptional regulator n=1 Tax=Kitasatospora sp. NPDC050543 TaxID=3364054 RepID=UPI003797FBAD